MGVGVAWGGCECGTAGSNFDSANPPHPRNNNLLHIFIAFYISFLCSEADGRSGIGRELGEYAMVSTANASHGTNREIWRCCGEILWSFFPVSTQTFMILFDVRRAATNADAGHRRTTPKLRRCTFALLATSAPFPPCKRLFSIVQFRSLSEEFSGGSEQLKEKKQTYLIGGYAPAVSSHARPTL